MTLAKFTKGIEIYIVKTTLLFVETPNKISLMTESFSGVESGLNEELDLPEKTDTKLQKVGRYMAKSLCAVGLGTLTMLGLSDSEITTEKLGARVNVESTIDVDMAGDVVIQSLDGEARYLTHNGPLGVKISIAEAPIVDTLKKLEGEEATEGLSDALKSDIEQLKEDIPLHVLRTLGLFGVGGFMGWLSAEQMLRREKIDARFIRNATLKGVMASTIMVGSIGGSMVATYDSKAGSTPILSGGLAYATENANVVKLLDEHDEVIAKTSNHFFHLVDAVRRTSPERKEPSTCLAVVADIQSRNVMSLLKYLVRTECVDAVVNAGDLTEYGLGVETQAFIEPEALENWRSIQTSVEELDVPFLTIGGNHDLPETIDDVARASNVIELNGQVVAVNGVRITGDSDPSFTPSDFLDGNYNVQNTRGYAAARLGREIFARIIRQDIDVVVVHSPDSAKEIKDSASLVISGDLHRNEPMVEVFDSGVVHYNQGSTGGSGLRAFRTHEENGVVEERPQAFSILHFDEKGNPYQAVEYNIRSLEGELKIRMETRTIDCTRACAE